MQIQAILDKPRSSSKTEHCISMQKLIVSLYFFVGFRFSQGTDLVQYFILYVFFVISFNFRLCFYFQSKNSSFSR